VVARRRRCRRDGDGHGAVAAGARRRGPQRRALFSRIDERAGSRSIAATSAASPKLPARPPRFRAGSVASSAAPTLGDADGAGSHSGAATAGSEAVGAPARDTELVASNGALVPGRRNRDHGSKSRELDRTSHQSFEGLPVNSGIRWSAIPLHHCLPASQSAGSCGASCGAEASCPSLWP